MNRPLWQILFSLSFAAFAVQRAAVGYTLEEGAPHPVLAVTWALLLVAAAATGLGVWFERSWAVGALIATGGLLVAESLQRVWLSGYPVPGSLAEMAIVVLVAGGLAVALRHGERHPADEPVQRDPPPNEGREERP